jgi:hypothetical protein
MKRPNSEVPAKWLIDFCDLRIDLPSWHMVDQEGRICSISTTIGEYTDHEHHLFFRKELIEGVLDSQRLSLVWVAWGERQHFSRRTFASGQGGYKYFQQIFKYADGLAIHIP